jgi:hypothetical protein
MQNIRTYFTDAAGCTPKEYRIMFYVNFFLIGVLLTALLVYVCNSGGKYTEYTTAIATSEFLGIQTGLFLFVFDIYSYYIPYEVSEKQKPF